MNRFILGLSVLSVGLVQAENGVALLKGTAEGSSIQGTITFTDTAKGLHLVADVQGAPAGNLAFHIHEFGSCADMGKAAGSHYNPLSSPHGHVLKDGMHKAHAGDLGNLTIDAQGKGHLDVVLPKLSLSSGKYTVGGRAVVLHEKADDFGQPVGNAGGRIGCGVIFITGK